MDNGGKDPTGGRPPEDPPLGAPVVFLDLDTDILDSVLLQLPLRERVRATTCCRQLAALSRTSERLWHSLQVNLLGLAEAESFAAWLAGRRGVDRAWVRGPAASPQLRWPSPLEAFTAANQKVLAAVEAAQPRAIRREAYSPVRLSEGSLASLQQLHWLSLAAPSVALPAALWRLTGLITLRLECGACAAVLPPGCLPASLRSLRCYCPHTADAGSAAGEGAAAGGRAPPAIYAATQLTRLELRINGGLGADVARLARFPALRTLALPRCSLECPPPQLAALLALCVLDLQGNPLSTTGEGEEERWQPLAALTGLQELSLVGCGLQSVPTAVMALPNLKVLHLMDNRLSRPAYTDAPPLVQGAALARLTELGLDMALSWRLAGALRAVPSLRVLHLRMEVFPLESLRSEASSFLEESWKRRALRELPGLPRLQRVTLDATEDAAARTLNPGALAWLAEFRRECVVRGLPLVRRDAALLPGLEGSTPWDSVQG